MLRFVSLCARPLRLSLFLLTLAGMLGMLLPVTARAQVTFNGYQSTLSSGFFNPFGVAVDGSGNVFVGDIGNNPVAGDTGIKEILAAGGYKTVITLPNSALFPYGVDGVAVDGGGNLFVADVHNNAVEEIPEASGYTTLNVLGSGTTDAAGVAVDGSGNVFVADSGNNAVKEILAAGGYTTVNTLASDFSYPTGVAVDGSGNVFVADYGNSAVKEIVAVGGSIPASPTVNTLGSGFSGPLGVAVDGNGNVYVADTYNNSVEEILAVGGSIPASPTINTLGSGFSGPAGVAVDGNGNVFVADSGNERVVKLVPQSSVNFGAQAIGSASGALSLDFTIAGGTIVANIAILTTGNAGSDFADAGSSTCTATTYASDTNCLVNVKFTPLAAGLRRGAVVFYNGSGHAVATVPVYGIGTGPQVTIQPGMQVNLGSGLTNPGGVAMDGNGNIFIADSGNNAVKEILAAGGYNTVHTLGNGFSGPSSLAVDGSGNVFVADTGNNAVKKIFAAGGYSRVRTLGSGFNQPSGVALDGSGNVYVGDTGNNAVKEILEAGGYTTVNTLGSGFSGPTGVSVDGSGNVYVTDTGNNSVKEILAVGGSIPASPVINTLGDGFDAPSGVAVDASGNVYVTDTGNSAVKEILAVGSAIPASNPTITSLGSGFSNPSGLAVDQGGNVFVADTGNSQVVKLDFVDPAQLNFATTLVGSTSSDSPKTVQVANVGNMPLIFTSPGTGSNPSYRPNFPENTGDTNLCASGTPLAPSATCDVSINFVPSIGGINSGDVELTDNALNQTNAVQTLVLLRGDGQNVPNVTWATPAAISYSTALSATQLNARSQRAGTFVYTPAAGTVLTAGTHTLSVLFTPTDTTDYATATAIVQLTVNQATPAINWPAPAMINYGLALSATQLDASSAVAGTFAYSPGLGTVLPVGTQSLSALFTPTDAADYTPATATVQLTVSPLAGLTSPTPGTMLGSSASFAWSAGSGVTQYALWLGSTGQGSFNLYNSGHTTATSTGLIPLPTNSKTIYAELFSYIGGVWRYTNYTFIAGGPPALNSPAPGSVVGTSVTFLWSPGTGGTMSSLTLGTTGVGSSDLYNSGAVTASSATATGLPTNSATIYARLGSFNGTAWTYADTTYIESPPPVKSVLISPAGGSVLGPTATFTWSQGTDVSLYALWLGSTGPGSFDLYNSGHTADTSSGVIPLPSNGATIYAQLFSCIFGTWQYTQYTFIAAGPPSLLSPAPGSVLGSNATFMWSPGTGGTMSTLLLGTSGPGSSDLYNSGNTTAKSAFVTGLPEVGGTIYAQLGSFIGGAWQYANYTYQESPPPVKAVLIGPAGGSTLASTANFSWTAGTGVTQYAFWLGTTHGGSDLYNSGHTTATSTGVITVPTTGATIYGQLYSYIDGVWQYTLYTFTEQ